jgi:hypothetical protein
MNSAAKVTRAPIGIRHELSLLKLKPEFFEMSLSYAEANRVACTGNDPRIFHGITAWARALRKLREILRKQGWGTANESNFELVISPDNTFAISVATGDRETGKYNPPYEPRLRNPKGLMYRLAINVNAWLFDDMANDAQRKTARLLEAQKRILWIFLMHREDDIVYSELSLPRKFSNRHVDGWKHRIILPPFDAPPLNEGFDDSDDGGSDDDSDAQEFDVEVVRRS